MTQRRQIDVAKVEAGEGGKVHVWGPPEEARLTNERFCSEEAKPGDVVIFHQNAIETSPGVFACLDCGDTSDPPKASA